MSADAIKWGEVGAVGYYEANEASEGDVVEVAANACRRRRGGLR